MGQRCWGGVLGSGEVTELTWSAGFTATVARIALGINGVGDEVGLEIRDAVLGLIEISRWVCVFNFLVFSNSRNRSSPPGNACP